MLCLQLLAPLSAVCLTLEKLVFWIAMDMREKDRHFTQTYDTWYACSTNLKKTSPYKEKHNRSHHVSTTQIRGHPVRSQDVTIRLKGYLMLFKSKPNPFLCMCWCSSLFSWTGVLILRHLCSNFAQPEVAFLWWCTRQTTLSLQHEVETYDDSVYAWDNSLHTLAR